MKVLTKEEEAAHYNATLKGGFKGLALGLGVGLGALGLATRRYAIIRNLTIPMKAFLVSSSSTFSAIIAADRASRGYEFASMPKNLYQDRASRDREQVRAAETTSEKLTQWGRDNRYPIVTASWVASMAIALRLVKNNPYLSKAQKLVQARVYAQGLTLAVLIVTALFEVRDANKGRGRWETVMVLDPSDPEHKQLIEKKIHHELYPGEDLWKGTFDFFAPSVFTP